MAVEWNEHRFSGGALALDTANTVVLRGYPDRTFDRFEDPREIARFAEAANRFRSDELAGRALEARDPEAARPAVIALREAVDALFRTHAAGGMSDAAGMASLLRACADGLDRQRGPVAALAGWGAPESGTAERRTLAFEAAVAMSALSLLQPQTLSRIKICANCNWLFIDRSRNFSRTWCDMKVCGNRHKAKRHYQRRKDGADV